MSTQVQRHVHNEDQTQSQNLERKKGLWSRLKKKFHTKPEDVESMFPALFGRALSGNQTGGNSERAGNFIASLPQQPAEQRRLAASLLAELDEYDRLQRRSYRNLPPLRFHVRVVRNVNGQTQRVNTVLNAAQLREKLVSILHSTSSDGRATQNLFADFMASGTTIAGIRRSVMDVTLYPSYKYTGAPLPEDKKMCAICLADYEVDEDIKTIPCMHFYHQACIDEWMSRSCVCPICKSKID
jgi:hypothetical protein